MVPSILQRYPGPSAVIQPQIMIEPPPCLMVCLTWCGCSLSPSRIQHQLRPSEPKRLTLVSSDHMTRFQSSTDQSLWARAKSKRDLMFFGERYGFFFFSTAPRPASFKARPTVRELTTMPSLMLSSLATEVVFSSSPEVIERTQKRLF